MPMSPYLRSLREQVGHDLLLVPGVTAVIRDGNRFLVARQRDTERWSFIGGSIEPGETSEGAVAREVSEELGVSPDIGAIVGVYGGKPLETTLPDDDQIAYVTVAFECTLSSTAFTIEEAELIETGWFTRQQIKGISRHEWIDDVLRDASR